MDLFLIPAILVHFMLVITCFAASSDAFRGLEHKKVIYGLIVVLPIVNVILTMLLVDIAVKRYRREIRYKNEEISDISRNLENERVKYRELERKKLMRVRVGDKFHVPNTDEWKQGFRNTECTIIELHGDEIIVKNKLSETRWSVKWHHLQYMVFLSNEPIKPFEFK